MVKKAFRTGSIRKLTPAERDRLYHVSVDIAGDMVDESVPTKARNLIGSLAQEVDAIALESSLGEALGVYRTLLEIDGQELPVAEQIRLTNECIDLMRELYRRLELLPGPIHAAAVGHEFKTWGDLRKLSFHRLMAYLIQGGQSLQGAVETARRWKSKRGVKPATRRANLILAVVDALRNLAPTMKLSRAREIARDLLRACGVRVPADLREFERLARQARNMPPSYDLLVQQMRGD
jgi:hypothetical protein